MIRLDEQLYQFKKQLMSELEFSDDETTRVCTTIAAEIRELSKNARDAFVSASVIPLRNRYEELKAFQIWMDLASTLKNPSVVRAQVIAQNYVCFVYLKDSCFEEFARTARKETLLRRCCHYLTSGDIRHFRNGFAHANWSYQADFSGLEAWARKKPHDSSSPLVKVAVSQDQLNFWQALARGVAYAIYETLLEMSEQEKLER